VRLKADVGNFDNDTAAASAVFENQLAHARRVTSSTYDSEQHTERQYKALAAEQLRLQKEVLGLLTNLKLDTLRENVMELVHANESQAVSITQLTPFREAFFEVDLATEALADAVDPLQEGRDAAFELYMLELDESRAFRHAADVLDELVETLDGLDAHAKGKLTPQAAVAGDALIALPGLKATIAALERDLLASRGEIEALTAQGALRETKQASKLAATEAKASQGQIEMREKLKAQTKQLLVIKGKLDDAEYELAQWASGAIRKANMSQVRSSNQRRKSSGNSPEASPNRRGSEPAETNQSPETRRPSVPVGGLTPRSGAGAGIAGTSTAASPHSEKSLYDEGYAEVEEVSERTRLKSSAVLDAEAIGLAAVANLGRSKKSRGQLRSGSSSVDSGGSAQLWARGQSGADTPRSVRSLSSQASATDLHEGSKGLHEGSWSRGRRLVAGGGVAGGGEPDGALPEADESGRSSGLEL